MNATQILLVTVLFSLGSGYFQSCDAVQPATKLAESNNLTQASRLQRNLSGSQETATQETMPGSWLTFGHQSGWFQPLELADRSRLRLSWTREVGAGRAQVIGDHDRLIVVSGARTKPADGAKENAETIVAAYSTTDGKPIWKRRFNAEFSDQQETFGGNPVAPQATPLQVDNFVIAVTFTGEVHCLDALTGESHWSIDLATRFQATPVQFGYSASPVACPESDAHFVLMAAGEKGGLIRMELATGKVDWMCQIESFSYATPTWGEVCGERQWVVVSQDGIHGISTSDGMERWFGPFREAGLTNVPSPILLDEQRVLISGQGSKGTQCFQIKRDGDDWDVEELWHNRRALFFYTNWLKLDSDHVIGCTEQYLTVIDCRDGNQLARARGFGNGNILRTESELLILDGRGRLQRVVYERQDSQLKLTHEQEFEVAQEQSWAAPTLIDRFILVREGKRLMCYEFASKLVDGSENDSAELFNQLEQAKVIPVSERSELASYDPVAQILNVFETKGQEEALKLYSKLRQDKQLSVEHRIELAEAANEAGLQQLTAMIVDHAKADFPNSSVLREAIKSWKER